MFLPYHDEKARDPGQPWITRLLIAVNLAAWIQTGVFDPAPGELWGQIGEDAAYAWGFVPAVPSLATAFTCMFLHGSLIHLLGNMWFLFLFGDNVELRVGHLTFLLFYVLSGLGGTAGHYLFHQDSSVPTIGASGAVYGVMGMYLFFFPFNRVRFFYFVLLFFGTIELSALWAIGYFFLSESLLAYYTAKAGIQTGIGHLAHAGGFVAGFLLALLALVSGAARDDGWSILAWLRGRRRMVFVNEDGREELQPRDTPLLSGPADPASVLTALVAAKRMEDARLIWRYASLRDPKLVLPPREMLDLAQYLDKQGDAGFARRAYERLAEFHRGEQPYEAEASLALAGLLLSEVRHTGDLSEAPRITQLLQRAVDVHPEPARKQLAQRWLSAVQHML